MSRFEGDQGSEMPSSSRELGAMILEASPEGIAGANQDGVLNFWNPAAARIFGYSESEIFGQPLSLILPEDQQRERVIQKVKEGGVVTGLEIKGRCKDGHDLDVALNISPVRTPAGRVIGMSIAIQDITERKRADVELREREERFFTLAHATNDTTYDWDLARDQLTWDAGLTTLFGYEPQKIPQTVLWWYEHLHPEDRERVMGSLQNALDLGAQRWAEKYRFLCADGNYAVVADRGFILRDKSGQACRMLGGMTDITESERANLRQAALLEIGDRLREQKQIGGIAKIAAEVTGRTLGAARAGMATVSPSGEFMETLEEWTNGELTTRAGRHKLRDCFNDKASEILRGEVLVSDNSAELPNRLAGVTTGFLEGAKAYLHVPVMIGNRVSEVLYVHDAKARRWSEQDISFARNIADRTLSAIQRVKSEHQLMESEARLRAIADLVPDLLWLHDPQGQCNWENRRWHEYTGQEESQSRGPGWLQVIHPEDQEKTLSSFRAALNADKPSRFEVRLRRADGQYRWFLIQTAPRFDVQGKVIQWFGAATDVHEQRMALNALQQKEEHYRMLIELAPHTVWLANWDGSIIYCNAWWYEYTGLTREQTEGMGWAVAIHPEHRPKLREAWHAAVRGGGEWNVEIPFRRASDGAYRWHLARGLPLRNAEGKIERWIGIAVDIHDRKEMTQALQREKALLEGLTESVLDGILIVSPDGKILYYNQRFLEIWGIPAEVAATRSEEAALGLAIKQVEDPEAFQARVFAIYQDLDHPIRTELRMKDGRVYDHFGAPVRKDGIHYGWVWTFRDITQQKRAEAELRESESKHQFLNRFNEAIREMSEAGAIMTAAAQLVGQHLKASCCAYADVEVGEEHFNIERDYAEGCAGLVGKYRLSLFGSGGKDHMQRGGTLVIYNSEEELAQTQSSDLFHSLGARAIICCPLVKNGQLKAIMLVHQTTPRQWKATEIHLVEAVVERCWATIERARAEQALRESEQRFRQLADAMPQLVWTTDAQGKPEFVNKQWFDYTGVKSFQNLGWLEAIHPDDRDTTMTRWKQSLETTAIYGLEQRIRGPEGYRWFQTRAVPIQDASGKVTKWFGTATDIDDVVRAREALARNQAELERLVAERTSKLQDTIAQLEAFSYSISHDMRGPLRAMQGFSYLLLHRFGDQLNEEATEYLRTIERSAKRLDHLIQDVLSYSRISRAEVQLQPVDVAQLVHDIVSQYPGLQAPRAHIRVEEPLPRVLGQSSYVTQVLSNLLSNAVKFVSPGKTPEVRVRAERHDGIVRIFIEDNGIGIDPKDQERIFNIFERVYSPNEFEGTGIGLSIVRKAVERMGGRIGLQSKQGEGSCFWIDLQAA